jgi:peptidyl-prolyl cis-trans isomerase D
LKAEDLASWNTLKSQIIMDKLNDKINTIVKKSVYTPTWMAKMAHNDQNLKINFNFVGIPYASVNDSEVKVTESELNAYIKENAGKFKVDEENRKFDYVLFNVAATQKDSADIATRLKEQMPILVESKDDSLLFVTTPGSIYEEKYVEKTQLAPQIADTVSSISVGTVFGPYVDGSKYKVAKLVDKMILADSVKARHLLRGVSQNQEQATYYEQMGKEIALVDSLIKELEKGTANFDSLTRKYSTDNSNKDKGGDLGVFGPGQMVAEFNDLVFFKSEIGKYYKVITQFGVHIVQVQNKYQSGKTGYKVGYIQESIIPSQDTEKDILRKASKFAASIKSLKELTDKAKKAGLEVQSTPIGAKQNDYNIAGVGQGDAAREIIKWGYDADAGDASNEVYRFESTGEDIYVEKFAVVGLRSVAKKGLATLADEAVRLQAETAVKNRKKAEIIKKKIDKGQSLDAIAAAFKSQVQVASQVSFNTPNVEGMGTEPKVVAAAFKQKVNKVSEPIAGNTAVFVVELTFKPEPTEPTDLPIAKEQAAASMRSQVDFALFQALRKQTPVEDYRYRFF